MGFSYFPPFSVNAMEKENISLLARTFYEELYSGRIKPSVHLEGISRIVRLGYKENILYKLWDFPWDLVHPCGCPSNYLSAKPTAKVLNLGSGVGLDGFYHALCYPGTELVVNLDIAPSSLVKSRQWASTAELFFEGSKTKFSWVCGDGLSLPIKGKIFDIVLMNGVFNICREKEKLFREVARVLVSGGILAISDLFVYEMLPCEISSDPSSWVWCIGGAITEEELGIIASETGFTSPLFYERHPVDNLFYRATCYLRLEA